MLGLRDSGYGSVIKVLASQTALKFRPPEGRHGIPKPRRLVISEVRHETTPTSVNKGDQDLQPQH